MLKEGLENAVRCLSELKDVEVYRFLVYQNKDIMLITERVSDGTVKLYLRPESVLYCFEVSLDRSAFKSLVGTLVNNQPVAVQLVDGSLCNLLPGSREDKLAIRQLVHFSQEGHSTHDFRVPYRLIASIHSSPFDADCLLTIPQTHAGCWAKNTITIHLFEDHVEVSPGDPLSPIRVEWDYLKLSSIVRALSALQPVLRR